MLNSLSKLRRYMGKEKVLTSVSIIISNCRVQGKITLRRKKHISLLKKLQKSYSVITSAF